MSKLILGTAQLSLPYGVTNESTQTKSDYEALEYLHFARSIGLSVVDTAPAYGDSEYLIGLSGENFHVHTKLDKSCPPAESVQNSLRMLCSDSIELLYIHDVENFKKNVEELAPMLEALLGKDVNNIGISLYDPHDVELVLQLPFITHVQIPVNLFDDRFLGDTMHRIKSAGVKCIVRSVFLQGVLLSDPYQIPSRVRHLFPYLQNLNTHFVENGLSRLEACLAFVHSLKDIDGVIVGAQHTHELSEIVNTWTNLKGTNPQLDWMMNLLRPEENEIDPRRW